MLLNEDRIQNNIDEFVEQHGVEGFFRLYFREYLFELLYGEVNAATGDKDADSGIQLHFSDELTTDEELRDFEEQLRNQCATRANHLVNRIQEHEEIRPLFEEGDVELLQEDEVEDMVTESMHDIIQEWEDTE